MGQHWSREFITFSKASMTRKCWDTRSSQWNFPLRSQKFLWRAQSSSLWQRLWSAMSITPRAPKSRKNISRFYALETISFFLREEHLNSNNICHKKGALGAPEPLCSAWGTVWSGKALQWHCSLVCGRPRWAWRSWKTQRALPTDREYSGGRRRL